MCLTIFIFWNIRHFLFRKLFLKFIIKFFWFSPQLENCKTLFFNSCFNHRKFSKDYFTVCDSFPGTSLFIQVGAGTKFAGLNYIFCMRRNGQEKIFCIRRHFKTHKRHVCNNCCWYLCCLLLNFVWKTHNVLWWKLAILFFSSFNQMKILKLFLKHELVQVSS